MTAATITAAVLGLVAVAALIYASMKADEAEHLREDNARLRASIGRHLREGIIYGQEVAALERRNAYLEQRRRVVMARWFKRRHYRTLSSWLKLGGLS